MTYFLEIIPLFMYHFYILFKLSYLSHTSTEADSCYSYYIYLHVLPIYLLLSHLKAVV